MAPKEAVNLANLEALGAKRLAEILLELGAEDAGIKRRLRFELRAEAGAEAVAADIGKRLTTLRRPGPSSTGRSGGPSSRTSTCSAG